jgi:hypothetical protein
MKLTDIKQAQWSTYVGLLTEVQKDELVGQQYTEDKNKINYDRLQIYNRTRSTSSNITM